MRTAPLKLIDAIAILIAQAYQLARVRLASHPSAIVRLTAERDEALLEAELLRRELAIFRAARAALPSRRRQKWLPPLRLDIIQLMRMRGWTVRYTAERFVVHENTIRDWIKELKKAGPQSRLFTVPAWNKIHDAVRWTVQELRRLFPEPEIGTRTLAVHVVRKAIQISRSTVQRILGEPEHSKPGTSTPGSQKQLIPPRKGKTDRLLKPKAKNKVWHLDLTTLILGGTRLTVAALKDGFSRKILELKVYGRTPSTRNMLALVKRAIAAFGKSDHLITDHGTQFKRKFTAGLKALGTHHAKGRVRCPATNSQLERFFRTFRLWCRKVLLPIVVAPLQRRLDRFRTWFNECRPHQALGGRTPEEVWQGIELPERQVILARDAVDVAIDVRRLKYRGDPRLPIVEIAVHLQPRPAGDDVKFAA